MIDGSQMNAPGMIHFGVLDLYLWKPSLSSWFLLFVVIVFVLPIARLSVQAGGTRSEQLRARVTALQAELARLKIPREEQSATRKLPWNTLFPQPAPPTKHREASLATSLLEAREQRPEIRAPGPAPASPPVTPIPSEPAMPETSAISGPSSVSPPRLEPIPERQPAFSFEKLKGS